MHPRSIPAGLVAAVILLAACGEPPAAPVAAAPGLTPLSTAAAATAPVVEEWISDLDGTRFGCTADSMPNVIALSGRTRDRLQTVVTRDGRLLQTFSSTPIDVSGVSVYTGERFRVHSWSHAAWHESDDLMQDAVLERVTMVGEETGVKYYFERQIIALYNDLGERYTVRGRVDTNCWY